MYQALYRKWRPQIFDDVIGQKHITETLKSQVRSGRLSHAYLFIGTRGTGKTTCARILARAVNCESPVDGNPCGKCAACRGILDGSVLDVVELDAASNNGVDNVRALREEAVFTPAAVRKRVYIIDEAHMLSTSAFNALLKIIEEPPEHLIFILATTELQKMPATILSRCQRHSFRRIETEELAAFVAHVAKEERFDLTDDAAALIARLAYGSVRDALSLLDQCSANSRIDAEAVNSALGLAGKKRIEELLDCVRAHDAGKAVTIFSSLWQEGKDAAGVLGELLTLLRDTLMLRVAPRGGKELLSGGHDPAVLKHYADAFTSEEILAAMNTLQTSLSAAKTARDPRTAAELCLVTLCSGLLKRDMPEFDARLSRIERTVSELRVSGLPAAPVREPAPVAAAPAADAPAVDEGGEDDPEILPDEPEDTDPEREEETDPGESGPDVIEVYREEQPEDAFLDKKERKENRTGAGPREETNEAASDGTPSEEDFWKELCIRVKPRLPQDMRIYPGDPKKLSGELNGGVLTLRAEPGFIFRRFDRFEILKKFSDCASEIAGRPVNTVIKEMDAAPVRVRSLDELKAFPETRVIG